MSYDDDIENILGGGTAKPDPHAALKHVPSRRQRRAAAELTKRTSAKAEGPSTDLVGTRKGVSVNWLSQVFKMTPENVRRRLADCPPVAVDGKANKYDVKDAAEYLVDPKIDLDRYLKDMKSSDLPASLQKEIWDARLKRQKWEVQAGELWHTSDVLAVLSSTFGIIKSSVQLWPDTVERQTGITDAQRELLIKLGDTLQNEVHQGLLGAAKERNTKPSLFSIDEDEEDDDLEDVL